MRSITFTRTSILPILIGIPISFSTSAGVQGDFKSGGSGGGAMDIEYVNNYPYSRCSQENIPSEDCKEFGYVFGEEPITFKQFIDLVMNTSAEQYRADMVSDNYNVPDNFHWLLPTEENLRYAKSQGMLQGDNLYPVFVDDGNKDEYLTEREIQLVHLPGASLPDAINDDTEVVGLLAAYALDSDGNIIPGSPGEPGSPGKIDPDKGEIIILDPHGPPPPPPSMLDDVISIATGNTPDARQNPTYFEVYGQIMFYNQELEDKYREKQILWSSNPSKSYPTWKDERYVEITETIEDTPTTCIHAIKLTNSIGETKFFGQKSGHPLCESEYDRNKSSYATEWEEIEEPTPEVDPDSVVPKEIYASVSMYEASAKRKGAFVVLMSPEKWELVGKPTAMNFKWYYGTGEPHFSTDSNYTIEDGNYKWRIDTNKYSKGKSFCLEGFYYNTIKTNFGNKHYRANKSDYSPICDGSSNGQSTSKYFPFMSLNLDSSDPNHPGNWYRYDNYD
jgi:hypothetical protein